MTFIKFPCGDLEPVKVLRIEGQEVCVQMPFGPFWTDVERVWMFP